MEFSMKLDKLMRMMGVSNSRLAKAIQVDASLVSRFRTGKRTPSKESNHFDKIAQYFISHATMEFQRVALFEILNITYYSNKNHDELLRHELKKWLSDNKDSTEEAFNGFISKIFDLKPFPSFGSDFNAKAEHIENAEIFYGADGKRQAVIHFLTTILNSKKSRIIYLYSDEHIDWLLEDEDYRKKWSFLLAHVLKKGHKIKIIHTVNRELSDMLAAIENWLPLYVTENIQSYYYPKFSNGIFRRTMFIAENMIALTSESITGKEATAANILYTDQEMIQSLTDTFNHYLGHCRPLIQAFTRNTDANFFSIISNFEKQEGNVICKSNILSLNTMPEDLFIELFLKNEKNDETAEKSILLFRELSKGFLNNLKNHRYIEIFSYPEKEIIKNNRIPVVLSEILTKDILYYTKEQFNRHLQNILDLMKNNENYHFYFSEDNWNHAILAKDGIGSIVVKVDSPSVIFSFNHPSMTNAMNAYLENEQIKINIKKNNKEAIINKIKKLIEFNKTLY